MRYPSPRRCAERSFTVSVSVLWCWILSVGHVLACDHHDLFGRSGSRMILWLIWSCWTWKWISWCNEMSKSWVVCILSWHLHEFRLTIINVPSNQIHLNINTLKLWFFGMWEHATIVLEGLVASIFRDECFRWEAVYASFYQTVRCHIPVLTSVTLAILTEVLFPPRQVTLVRPKLLSSRYLTVYSLFCHWAL